MASSTKFEQRLIASGSLKRLLCARCVHAVEAKFGTACGWKLPVKLPFGFIVQQQFPNGLPDQKAIHGPWDESHPKFTDHDCPQFKEAA
jgi:hypothetical protein